MKLFGELGITDIPPDDIEACDVVRTQRKDRKRVVLCRLLSRNNKDKILAAKKGRRTYS